MSYVGNVSSNGGHCTCAVLKMDGARDAVKCSSRPYSPDVYMVRVHAYVRDIRMYPICVTPSALTVLSAKSDEETSDGLDGQNASCPLSVDCEAVSGGEQAHTQRSPPHVALPLTCPLCKRETSQTVFVNKTTGGLVCPPCKVHGELVRLGGPSGAVRERGSNV